MFNGQMKIDSSEPVSKLPSYEAWNHQVGEHCFYRGGQNRGVFFLDPRWKRFEGFRHWWDMQQHPARAVVSSVLAPGDSWRVLGPDTCRMLPLRLHSFLMYFYKGKCFENRGEVDGRFTYKVRKNIYAERVVLAQATDWDELEEEIQDNVGMYLRNYLSLHTLDPKTQRAAERKIAELEGFQASTMPFMD